MAKVRTDPGPARWHSRTVAGVKLTPHQFDDGSTGWQGTIAGQLWLFNRAKTEIGTVAHKRWRAHTDDHLTGGPRSLSLKKLVAWVIEHQGEWQAKLTVRRAHKTRMVDPKPAA